MDGAANDPQLPASAHVATVPVEAGAIPRRVVTGPVEWRGMFAAFRHRNYRMFFVGQFVSLIGTWMQMVAQGWLVYQLSNSSLILGLIPFLSGLPVTFLSLPAGVLADRMEKRRVLIVTQAVAMALCFVLAVLTHFGVVTVWHVAAIGVLLGVTNAFDMPARQSFVTEMVGKDDLMNAIALNSSMFNGARVFGPALAGLLLAWVGAAGCFFFNAVSYLAVIAAYALMRLPAPAERSAARSLRQEMLEALRYVWGDRSIRATVFLVAVLAVFAVPFTVLLPVFARDILRVGPTGFGFLVSAHGIGGMLGALMLAALGNSPHRERLFFAGVFGLAAMLVLLAISRNAWLSGGVLLCVGWFMIVAFASANTSVQLRAPDALRGRVMAIYVLAFLGLGPFGGLLAGALAHATSAPVAVACGAGVSAAAALIAWRGRRDRG